MGHAQVRSRSFDGLVETAAGFMLRRRHRRAAKAAGLSQGHSSDGGRNSAARRFITDALAATLEEGLKIHETTSFRLLREIARKDLE